MSVIFNAVMAIKKEKNIGRHKKLMSYSSNVRLSALVPRIFVALVKWILPMVPTQHLLSIGVLVTYYVNRFTMLDVMIIGTNLFILFVAYIYDFPRVLFLIITPFTYCCVAKYVRDLKLKSKLR